MVRLPIVPKRTLTLFGTAVYLAVQLTVLQTLFIKPPVAKADTFQRTLVSSSSGNTSRFIPLRDHALRRGEMSWPTRNFCTPPGSASAFKTLPYYANQPSGGYSGNFMDGNGNCSTRYTDGGWSAGAWFQPTAFGGWATGTGVISLGPAPGSGPASDKMNNCSAFPGRPQKRWGAGVDNSDHAYGSNGLFARNGRSGLSAEGGINLYSHGTTLYRANFSLSAADLDSIRNGTYYTSFLGVADDWMRVYINGLTLVSESDSAVTQVRQGFRRAIIDSLVVGNNSIAIQASDKAVWSGSPTNPGRGAGLCYELNLYSIDTPPVDVCPGIPDVQTNPADCPPPTDTPTVACAIPAFGAAAEVGRPFDTTVYISASPGTYTGGTATISITPNPGTPSGGIAIPPPASMPVPNITGLDTVTKSSITIANRGNYTVRWTISGGNAGSIGPPCERTIEVITKPYFRVEGGDIQAGNKGSCGGLWSGVASGIGGIYGWHTTSPLGGARTNLAAMALQRIEGFASGDGTGARAPKRLTFANSGAGAGSTAYGGGVGASAIACPHSYDRPATFSGSALPNTFTTNILGTNPALSSGVYEIAGASGLSINRAALLPSNLIVNTGVRITLFVTGDVRINNNIIYAPGGWTLQSIPSLTIIATGNIYIDASVTNLEGTYVARGTIFTCALGGSPANAIQIRDNCTNTLTVHGSLIARAVKLLRSRGSMSNSTAAEVFNYGPESWLVSPPGLSTGLDFTVDSILNLPPVL